MLCGNLRVELQDCVWRYFPAIIRVFKNVCLVRFQHCYCVQNHRHPPVVYTLPTRREVNCQGKDLRARVNILCLTRGARTSELAFSLWSDQSEYSQPPQELTEHALLSYAQTN